MDIIEFQKRWIMRYINPIFFYLPFQSCQVNEIGFYIKVLLWNTYNPVKDEYKNRLTEKGRLINRPCDYYKILITYLGDESKDDKTRREELVYCSSLNNGGQKESYDEGVLHITQMADGSSLKPGKYKAHIFATYGLGAPAKEDDVNCYQYFEFYPYKDNERTYPIYVNWHFVELKTYTGNPTYVWEYNMGPHDLGKSPNYYTAGVNDNRVNKPPLVDPISNEHVVKDLYSRAKCQLSNCQTHQILKDNFSKEEIAKVPLAEEPIAYDNIIVFLSGGVDGLGIGRSPVATPKYAVASSRCCFNMSQSYAYALFGKVYGVLGIISGHKAFGYIRGKGTLKVELEEKKGSFSLKDPITSEDYSETTYDYAYEKDLDISLNYRYWDNFVPGTAYKNIEINSGNLPCVYLSFTAECSQEEMFFGAPLDVSLTPFHAYPEVSKEHSGYRKTDFMGQKAVIPIGGDYQSFKQGIFACKDGNPPQQTKYIDAYDEIRFGTPDPHKYATGIEIFDLYNMNLFKLEGKQGYYTKSELADALVNIASYKPWSDEELEMGECDENPKYQFTFEMTADEGSYELRRQKSERSPENPILFYLNDEQAWKGCTGYALCDFLPAELPYPNLSIYQTNKKEETVSEN